MATLLTSCSESGERSAETARESETPSSLHWPAVEGAERYRVQAWHEKRLLFEISRDDTVAVLTPSLERAMAPFETIEIQVRALTATGESLGEVHRWRWEG